MITETLIGKILEYGIVALAFMYLLHFMTTGVGATLKEISVTMKEFSTSLQQVSQTLLKIDMRVEQLERRVDTFDKGGE